MARRHRHRPRHVPAPGGEYCYWARLADLTGGSEADSNGIIDNQAALDAGQVLVEILPTDVAFETNDCGTWTPV